MENAANDVVMMTSNSRHKTVSFVIVWLTVMLLQGLVY